MAGAIDATEAALGQAAWFVLVIVAVAVIPVLVIRRFVGVRPTAAAPEVASFEMGDGPRHRRAAFSPLIGDFQAN